MRRNLLPAVATISIIYLLAGFFLYSFVPASKIPEWLMDGGINYEGEITAFTQALVVFESFMARLEATGRFLIIGIGSALLMVSGIVITMQSNLKLRKQDDNWKSMGIKNSIFPRPNTYSGSVVGISGPSAELPKPQKKLLKELLGYAYDHADWFVGKGHGEVGLFDHTINVMEKATEYPEPHRLLLIAAAAHDLGKTITFENYEGVWERVKQNHDYFSHRILISMPSWESLPEPDRRVLSYAVKYEHNPENMPISISTLSKSEIEEANILLSQLREIDGLASKEEAEVAIEKSDHDVPELVVTILKNHLREGPIYEAGNRKDSIGFFDGKYVYLLEYCFREKLKADLPSEISVQLGLEYRARSSLSPGIIKALQYIDDAHFLVTKMTLPNKETVEVLDKSPLWNIRVQDREFQAIIIIEPPSELVGALPLSLSPITTLSPYQRKYSRKIGENIISHDTSIDNVELLSARFRIDGSRKSKPQDPKELGSNLDYANEANSNDDSRPAESPKLVRKSSHKKTTPEQKEANTDLVDESTNQSQEIREDRSQKADKKIKDHSDKPSSNTPPPPPAGLF